MISATAATGTTTATAIFPLAERPLDELDAFDTESGAAPDEVDEAAVVVELEIMVFGGGVTATEAYEVRTTSEGCPFTEAVSVTTEVYTLGGSVDTGGGVEIVEGTVVVIGIGVVVSAVERDGVYVENDVNVEIYVEVDGVNGIGVVEVVNASGLVVAIAIQLVNTTDVLQDACNIPVALLAMLDVYGPKVAGNADARIAQ